MGPYYNATPFFALHTLAILLTLGVVTIGAATLATDRWKLFVGAVVADIILTAATPLIFGPANGLQIAVELLGVFGPPAAVLLGIWLRKTHPQVAEAAVHRLIYDDVALSTQDTPSGGTLGSDKALTAEELAELSESDLEKLLDDESENGDHLTT